MLFQNDDDGDLSPDGSGNSNRRLCPSIELSFEYLMAKNTLKWISITSEHAMLMSVCLQSIVDELLNQKDGHDLSESIDSVNSIIQHVEFAFYKHTNANLHVFLQKQPNKRTQPQSLPVLTYIRRDGEMCDTKKKNEKKRISSTSSNETLSSLVGVTIHRNFISLANLWLRLFADRK